MALGPDVTVGFDPAEERREHFEEEIGGVGVSSLEDGLDQGVDLAVIASPNRFHIEQATICAQAGCHLLIEKPLGTSLKGVAELREVSEERGLFVHIGSNFKFHPAMQMMRSLVTSGELGRVTGAQVLAGQWLPGWHPGEDYRCGYSASTDLGGGVVLDTHEFDYLTWLLGRAVEIRGFTTRSGSLDVETEDVACACLWLEGGVLATVQVDYIQRDYRRRYHISGDAGTVEWDFSTGNLSVYRVADDGREVLDFSEDINEMYVRQTEHVLDGVAGKAEPITPLEQAAHVLSLQLLLKEQRV
jgi:predicted dehydrogenase